MLRRFFRLFFPPAPVPNHVHRVSRQVRRARARQLAKLLANAR
jgi:hypothetical protein